MFSRKEVIRMGFLEFISVCVVLVGVIVMIQGHREKVKGIYWIPHIIFGPFIWPVLLVQVILEKENWENGSAPCEVFLWVVFRVFCVIKGWPLIYNIGNNILYLILSLFFTPLLGDGVWLLIGFGCYKLLLKMGQ